MERAGALLFQFAAAVVFTALMVAMRSLLDPWLGDKIPFITVFGAVSFAVWIGGYLPALLAAAVGYVACDYLFIEPRGSFALHGAHDYIRLGLFAVTCSLIIGLGEGMRSARRHAETSRRRLAEFAGKLRIVTESMDAPVARCTRDLRYQWVSKPYAELIGKSVDQVVGSRIVDILGPEAFERIEPYFRRALAGEKVKYEEVVNFANIGPRWVNAIYTPTFDAGANVDGWVAVVIDVTEQRRLAQSLTEADRRKDEFLAMLAHELRNPLSPIRNALAVQKLSGEETKVVADARAIMERQVDQLVRLVDDLLDVSRIKTAKLDLRKEYVRLLIPRLIMP